MKWTRSPGCGICDVCFVVSWKNCNIACDELYCEVPSRLLLVVTPLFWSVTVATGVRPSKESISFGPTICRTQFDAPAFLISKPTCIGVLTVMPVTVQCRSLDTTGQ